MIGPGILLHIANVVPFAYFIISPLALGRGNFAGNRNHAFRNNYYRRFYQRMFFGRTMKIFIPSFIVVYIFEKYIHLKKVSNLRYFSAFAPVSSYTDSIDEEVCREAKIALRNFKELKLIKNKSEELRLQRAKLYYQLKSEAFEESLANYKL